MELETELQKAEIQKLLNVRENLKNEKDGVEQEKSDLKNQIDTQLEQIRK
jgi:hypothetical protein